LAIVTFIQLPELSSYLVFRILEIITSLEVIDGEVKAQVAHREGPSSSQERLKDVIKIKIVTSCRGNKTLVICAQVGDFPK
jgi:formate hydrogenlyase subunit 4